ncbi:MAG: putative ABC transporter permease [Bacilli bacterium]|nr:putative ABC transporter permease [Bacilli bacterium]MCI9585486.1 putative ABC transporter permease [Bacilli bacterium]
MEIRVMFLLFILYSFLGWLMEVILVSIQTKKPTDRGFLIGPLCPIYGVGALLITILLNKYSNDLPALFIMATILGAILEYFTSYIMEKIFKTRWWDYSDKKYNINGRISLTTSIGFGILGVILIHILNPFFKNILNHFSNTAVLIISVILLIIFIIDIITSFRIISKIKIVNTNELRDSTDEITQYVRETLRKHSILTKRLVIAFPNLNIQINKDLNKMKEKHKKIV